MKELEDKKQLILSLQSKLKQTKPEKIDEETIRSTIQTHKQNKLKRESLIKNISSISKELDTAQKEHSSLEESYKLEYEEIKDPKELETSIQEKESELLQLQTKSEETDSNIKKIEEWQRYTEELGRYKEWDTKVKSLSESEEKSKKEYAASTLLKDKILEAESLAILNIINSINIHAQEYLDLFFPDNPIVVRLLPFKTTKKSVKPQINIEIDYKGMEADLSMLSGGELSRVVLSYTLALSEIFNSPIVMLDECTSSLDAELTSTVMDGIRKNFGNKLVIIIAHQVIEGDFDRQINL